MWLLKLCFYSKGVKAVPFFNHSDYEMLPSSLNSVSGPINIPNGFPFGNSFQTEAYVRIDMKKLTPVMHNLFPNCRFHLTG